MANNTGNEIVIRKFKEGDDLELISHLINDAFQGFAKDFNMAEHGLNIDICRGIVHNSKQEGIIACKSENENEILGVNFLSPKEDIDNRGIGPIAVKRGGQGGGVGKKLMEGVIQKAKNESAKTVALMQDAGNYTSLSLYLKLGFEVIGEYATFIKPENFNFDYEKEISTKYTVRSMNDQDVSKVSELMKSICGFSNDHSIKDCVHSADNIPIQFCKPFVIFEENELVGFNSAFHTAGMALAKNEEVFKQLFLHVCKIGKADPPLQVKVSVMNNPELVRWLLSMNFKIWKTYNHMILKGGQNQIQPRKGSVYIPTILGF